MTLDLKFDPELQYENPGTISTRGEVCGATFTDTPLLPIPPLSVAAHSFVLAFVRDRGGENLPGMMESTGAVLQATLVSAILFALMAAMMLLLTRLITRFF